MAAVFVGKDTAVVPFSHLRKKPVVQFRLGTTPAVVFFKADVASVLDAARIAESANSGTSAAFDR